MLVVFEFQKINILNLQLKFDHIGNDNVIQHLINKFKLIINIYG